MVGHSADCLAQTGKRKDTAGHPPADPRDGRAVRPGREVPLYQNQGQDVLESQQREQDLQSAGHKRPRRRPRASDFVYQSVRLSVHDGLQHRTDIGQGRRDFLPLQRLGCDGGLCLCTGIRDEMVHAVARPAEKSGSAGHHPERCPAVSRAGGVHHLGTGAGQRLADRVVETGARYLPVCDSARFRRLRTVSDGENVQAVRDELDGHISQSETDILLPHQDLHLSGRHQEL